MAGALLLGNVPNERQEEFREYMVEINLNDSNESISSTIQWWINHEEERIRRYLHWPIINQSSNNIPYCNSRATIGQMIACKKYTYEKFVDRVSSSFLFFFSFLFFPFYSNLPPSIIVDG